MRCEDRLSAWIRVVPITMRALGLLVTLGGAGNIAWEVHRDPTSHNLWSLELLALMAFGITFVVIASKLDKSRARGPSAPERERQGDGS